MSVFERVVQVTSRPVQLAVLGGLMLLLWFWYEKRYSHRRRQLWPGFPLIALTARGLNPRESWKKDAAGVISKGREVTDDGIFQVMTGTGPKIVLPNRFLDELKSHKDLDLAKAFSEDMFWDYSGMIAFRATREATEPILKAIRTKGTAAMYLVIEELAEECSFTLNEQLHHVNHDQWTGIAMQPVAEELIAHLSTLLFLGKDFCRHRRWLDIVRGYAFNAFRVVYILRLFSPSLQPLAHYFLPQSRELRRHCSEAEAMIKPAVEQRRRLIESGEYSKTLKSGDVLGWLYEASSDKNMDYTGAQLTLSVAAIHTTTEALLHAIMDVWKDAELLQALRDEVVQVLRSEGWTKQAFAKMRLLDSVLKESQRMNPSGIGPVNRYVLRPILLSNGTLVPEGATVFFCGKEMDPTKFANPHTFDGRRFLKAREQSENEHASEHTFPTPELIAFGYGTHACPGRFFANMELKISLAHLLLMFDFRFNPSEQYTIHTDGVSYSNPVAKMEIRRREAEIDLSGLVARSL